MIVLYKNNKQKCAAMDKYFQDRASGDKFMVELGERVVSGELNVDNKEEMKSARDAAYKLIGTIHKRPACERKQSNEAERGGLQKTSYERQKGFEQTGFEKQKGCEKQKRFEVEEKDGLQHKRRNRGLRVLKRRRLKQRRAAEQQKGITKQQKGTDHQKGITEQQKGITEQQKGTAEQRGITKEEDGTETQRRRRRLSRKTPGYTFQTSASETDASADAPKPAELRPPSDADSVSDMEPPPGESMFDAMRGF